MKLSFKDIPLQQGLKRVSGTQPTKAHTAFKDIPLQQGLKQCVQVTSVAAFCGF